MCTSFVSYTGKTVRECGHYIGKVMVQRENYHGVVVCKANNVFLQHKIQNRVTKNSYLSIYDRDKSWLCIVDDWGICSAFAWCLPRL